MTKKESLQLFEDFHWINHIFRNYSNSETIIEGNLRILALSCIFFQHFNQFVDACWWILEFAQILCSGNGYIRIVVQEGLLSVGKSRLGIILPHMGVPMLISKHALNCCKVSANREKYKNKSHLFFISEGPPTFLK